MTLHLLKLCVGAESIADLEGWIGARLALERARGLAGEQKHTTRMVPKRAHELLEGGSLYWVIKGQIAARQTLLDIRPFTDGAGIGRCDLVLEPVVVPLLARPCRPFQSGAISRRAKRPVTWPPPEQGRRICRKTCGGSFARWG